MPEIRDDGQLRVKAHPGIRRQLLQLPKGIVHRYAHILTFPKRLGDIRIRLLDIRERDVIFSRQFRISISGFDDMKEVLELACTQLIGEFNFPAYSWYPQVLVYADTIPGLRVLKIELLHANFICLGYGIDRLPLGDAMDIISLSLL